MLGIPTTQPEATTFLISFWAALYSGLIYSIFTGLVVGLVILLVQRHLDDRRSKKEFERELALFKEKLHSILEQPDIVNISTITGSAPPAAIEIAKLLQENPIDLWFDYLPKHRPFLQRLKDIRSLYYSFNSVANKLELNLNRVIRKHNASKDIHSMNDGYDKSYFLGRINETPSIDVLKWLDMPEKSLPRFEESYNIAVNEKMVNEYIEPYQTLRANLSNNLNSLRDVLEN